MPTATFTPPDRQTVRRTVYGTIAMFNSGPDLLAATGAAHRAGYRHMDAFSPVPVEGVAELLGHHRTRMPLIILAGGVAGGLGGYFMQWFSMTVDYPFNVGGRPFHSWPMFIPITFETTVLCAAVAGVLGMLFLNGLPRLHHPVFAVAGIERATRDRFFLCIESSDPRWDLAETRRFLEQEAGSALVQEVPR